MYAIFVLISVKKLKNENSRPNQYGPMSKMDLKRKMVFEKPSEIKIIKRIVRTKLIEKTDHQEDKRSKLLMLTSKGESDILVAYEKASPIRKRFPLVYF